MAASVVLAAGAAVDGAGVAVGVVAACVAVAGGVEAGVVVAVWTFVCGVAAGACGAAGCSAAGWFALVAAKLRLRGPPANACVVSKDIAAIRISLRMETPVIWSIRLTYLAPANR